LTGRIGAPWFGSFVRAVVEHFFGCFFVGQLPRRITNQVAGGVVILVILEIDTAIQARLSP
jgi:hypothetical protein